MQKINKISVFLFSMFMMLPIISILMINHITLSQILGNIDTGVFGDGSSAIAVKSEYMEANDLYEIINDYSNSIAVYSDYKLSNTETIRYLYFNKSYINLPMESGRYFIKNDLKPNNHVAVVGKKLVDQTYQENGTTFIDISEKKYKVIGIYGYEEDTAFDSYIFVNGYNQDKAHYNNIYRLDFFNDDGSNISKEIQETLKSKNNIDSEFITYVQSYSDSLLPKILYARWFIGILVCSILCILLLSIEWFRQKKKEFCIRRLVGASNRAIICLILKKYIWMMLCSMIVSFIYCRILYPAYCNFLFIGLFSYLPVAVLFLGFTTINILKIPIVEAIK